MKRHRGVGVWAVLAGLAGCAAPAERLDVPPVPADVENLTFPDVLTRARLQAGAATEAFYVDNWPALETAARSLEQTARLIPTSKDVPAEKLKELEAESARLVSHARELAEAARRKDIATANERLQRIALQIRNLQVAY